MNTRVPTEIPAEDRAWRGLERIHVVLGLLAVLAATCLAVVVTLHATVTTSELEHATAPIQSHAQRITAVETRLDGFARQLDRIADNVYHTGLQVGAPVSPPPVHVHDAGVTP